MRRSLKFQVTGFKLFAMKSSAASWNSARDRGALFGLGSGHSQANSLERRRSRGGETRNSTLETLNSEF